MTNKEFEAKKQDIFKNLDKALGFLQNEDLYKCSNIIWDTMKDLKQLQPPKPPTCATCDHINLKCSPSAYNGFLCKNISALNADGDAVSTSGGYNIRIKNIDNFGCIHHSDYEVAE